MANVKISTLASGSPASALDGSEQLEIVQGGTSKGATASQVRTYAQTGARLQGKETIYVPARAMVSRTTNGAGDGTAETATGKVMQKTKDFDTTTQEFTQFDVAPPKSWDLGTITYVPYWTATGGTSTQTVVFALQGVAISNDDPLDASFGTEQTSSDTLIAAGDVHVGPESSAITIGGTPAAGDLVFFQLKRNVSSDDLSVDAKLLGLKIHFTTNAQTDA